MSKYLFFVNWLLYVAYSLMACSSNPGMDFVEQQSGRNFVELKKVLAHFSNDSLKLRAAQFLIANMGDKFCYEGEILDRYDTIFHVYHALSEQGITEPNPPVVNGLWDELIGKYGMLNVRCVNRRFDSRCITSDYLIRNIDLAFRAWQEAPPYISRSWDDFCQYVLPYRVGNAPLEEDRLDLYNKMREICDSACGDYRTLLHAYHRYVSGIRRFKDSRQMWRYPFSLPHRMQELSRRGACRHWCEYTIDMLRSYGLPATMDFVPLWANRSNGHEWVVLLLDSCKTYAFDALGSKQEKMAYKPSKVFRKTFEIQLDVPATSELPPIVCRRDCRDVTEQYGKTYDVAVPCARNAGRHNYGVICTFDNMEWRPVYWGKMAGRRIIFRNMMPGNCYLAAVYEKERIIPVNDPFTLDEDGHLRFICTTAQRKSLELHRKYPKFERIASFSKGLLGACVEGANDAYFQSITSLYTFTEVNDGDVVDIPVDVAIPFRYLRLHFADGRKGHVAELEFYGCPVNGGDERKLSGTVFGPAQDTLQLFKRAMDGDFASYYSQESRRGGYVGLDLGSKNFRLTKLRYCPRSDTNFIIPGHKYRLKYWGDDRWNDSEEQIAQDFYLHFDVPSDGLYVLNDLTQGKEERIFTYENSQQVWW